MKGVIIALAILVLCAVVSYSFEDLTGFLIKAEPTSIDITSSITVVKSAECKEHDMACVEAGYPITITVNTGTKGTEKYLTIHKHPSKLRRARVNWCTLAGGWLSEKYTRGFKCYGIKSVNYRVASTWPPGIYYTQVYDYTLPGYITEPFEVI